MRELQALCEGGGASTNEDGVLITHDTFAVLDGATGLVPSGDPGPLQTGGSVAATLTAAVLSGRPDLDLLAAATAANEALRRRMRAAGVDLSDRISLWATALAAVRINGDLIHYLTIGNCLALCVTTEGQVRLLTPHVNHDAPTLRSWRSLAARGISDPGAVLRLEMLHVREQANRTYGYLNGEPEAIEFLRHGSIERRRISHLLLFSDGLQIPVEDPDAPDDWSGLWQLVHEGGLLALRDHVRALQGADPSCTRYPRFKQYDDMAGLLLHV